MGNVQKNGVTDNSIAVGFDHLQIEPEGAFGPDNYTEAVLLALTYSSVIKSVKPTSGKALRDACLRGDIHRVKEAVEVHKVDINCQGTDIMGWTPLLIAVAMCHYELFMYLLEKGADINKTNFNKETALFRAVMWNRSDMVEQLLARPEIDVTIANINNRTAIVRAIGDGFTGCVRLIMNNCAQFKGKPEELKTFLNVHWYRHGTLFYTASHKGRLEILQLLEEAGADPLLQDNIPLTQKAPTEIPSRRPAKRVRAYLDWLKLDVNDDEYLLAVTAHSNHLWFAMNEKSVFCRRSQELLLRHYLVLQDARDAQGNSLLHRNAFKGGSVHGISLSLSVYPPHTHHTHTPIPLPFSPPLMPYPL